MTERPPAAVPRRWARLLALAAAAAVLALGARQFGLAEHVRPENLQSLRAWILGFGVAAPAVFVAGHILAVVAFVPGFVPTVLGGLVFGPVWGTVYVSVASTLGACLAFLIARHAARGIVEPWVRRAPALRRLDAAVAQHGARIVMVTRLVPIFPFNLQNYAYGVTAVRFVPYALASWLAMLPATASFTFAAGAASAGDLDARRTLGWLAAAGVLLATLSLVARWLRRRSPALAALLGAK